MQKRTNKIRKTKFYVEFIKFYKCPLTGFEPRTPSSQDFLNFDENTRSPAAILVLVVEGD